MRLVLCDDHRLFAEPLAVALERRGHEVIVSATPAEALRAAAAHLPDLCVIDLTFPEGDGDGMSALRELRRRFPECPVVVLSGSADDGDRSAAIAAGAAGFLRKNQPVSTIFDALDRIAAGREVPSRPLARTSIGLDERARVRRVVGQLTSRERDVLRLLVRAHDTTAIAGALGVAPSTIRTHLQSVLMKLGVHSRMQAVALLAHTQLETDL